MQNKVKIMGILNVTPDSFSDGGRFSTVEEAVQHALNLINQGADIIDVGGESSGPGSKSISLEEEARRVLPVIESILERNPSVFISVDTYKSELARRAISLGAKMINDVTALRADSEMGSLIAETGVKIVLMYSKDTDARTTRKDQRYQDVIAAIKGFFEERIDYLKSFGILDSRIVLDPGMGHFVSALPEYSFEIIDRLAELKDLGYPILLGPSRKSFLGGKLEERDELSIKIALKAARNGADVLRMHDVKGIKKALSFL